MTEHEIIRTPSPIDMGATPAGYRHHLKVAETVNALFDKVTKPEFFGAVGDGVTDDSDALQKAVTKGLTDSVPVLLDRLYYTGTTTITVGSNSTLIGKGKGTLSGIKYAGSGDAIDMASGVLNEEIVFKDFTLTLDTSGANGIHAHNYQFLNIEGCKFYSKNTNQSLIVLDGSVDDFDEKGSYEGWSWFTKIINNFFTTNQSHGNAKDIVGIDVFSSKASDLDSVVGTFVEGETVIGSQSGAVGVIAKIDGSTYYVNVSSYAIFFEGEEITGQSSSATGDWNDNGIIASDSRSPECYIAFNTFNPIGISLVDRGAKVRFLNNQTENFYTAAVLGTGSFGEFKTNRNESSDARIRNGTYVFTMSSPTGYFEIGETVEGQTSGETARVVYWSGRTGNLLVTDASGAFNSSEDVTGGTTSTTETISAIIRRVEPCFVLGEESSARVFDENNEPLVFSKYSGGVNSGAYHATGHYTRRKGTYGITHISAGYEDWSDRYEYPLISTYKAYDKDWPYFSTRSDGGFGWGDGNSLHSPLTDALSDVEEFRVSCETDGAETVTLWNEKTNWFYQLPSEYVFIDAKIACNAPCFYVFRGVLDSSGVVTSDIEYSHEDDAGFNVSISVSSNTPRIQVTGVATYTVKWVGKIRLFLL